jgi:hypothetical protein
VNPKDGDLGFLGTRRPRPPHLRPRERIQLVVAAHLLTVQMVADCAAVYEVLIAEMLFDYVEERLAVAIAAELFEEEEHGVIEPVGGVIGAMRGEQDVC